jgi:DNA-binding MarR family transcriptional regulator
MHPCHSPGVDADLSAMASALNELYRLSSSPRFHADTVASTGVQVSRTGLKFLSLVHDSPGIGATQLAAALDVSQPTASRVLQQLEADGLVARHASDSDGRASHYVTTRKGARALDKVHGYHVDQLAQALADVDAGRRAALAGAVTELVSKLHADDRSSRRTA